MIVKQGFSELYIGCR